MTTPHGVPLVPQGHAPAGLRLHESASRRLLRRLGDRFVGLADDLLDEDLDGKLARVPRVLNEVGYDRYGGDLKVGRYALAVAAFLHRRYFRTQVFGIDRLPPGRSLVVANHSGQIPLDGLILGAALMLDASPPRFPRSMVEKWSAELPFVSVFFQRCGQVLGLPENARGLLEQEQTLVVFPEGVRGISKPFDRRYQLEAFGLGFARLALETRTPIVPAAVIGAEEQYISVANLEPLARLFRMPVFPVVPQLAVLGPLPLPVRYRLYFGDPVYLEGDPDEDDAVLGEKVAAVRATIQSMIYRGLRERASIFR